MATHSRKYDPPKTGVQFGNITVDALITPNGEYISIEYHVFGSEASQTLRIDVPKKIIERELAKF